MRIVLTKNFPWRPYVALTLKPWIFIRKDYYDQSYQNYYDRSYQIERLQVTIRHEEIHIEQQEELGYIGFFSRYLYWFVKGLIVFGSWDEAYRNIPFEAEAYEWAYKIDYLSHRKKNDWKVYRY